VKILGVIPVRYDSKRFPGKALRKIHGRTILEWVYRRAARSRLIDRLIIATDDTRIVDCAYAFGAEVFLSRRPHSCGSERVAEVARRLRYPVVVNIQGDEVTIRPEIISHAIRALLSHPRIWAGTVAFRLRKPEKIKNPDLVKVVVDRGGRGLYFSRSIIPYSAAIEDKATAYYGHIGVYAFRNKYLQKFAGLKPGTLELAEQLEQLRILENGGTIAVAFVNEESISINRRADLRWAEKNLDWQEI